MPTRILTSADVETLSDAEGMRDAMRAAHEAVAGARALQPPPRALRAGADGADDAGADDAGAVVPMMAISHELGLFAVKVLADAPRNRALGFPAQRSTVAVFDAESAECVALVDGRSLTRLRTAAVTAVATDALAPRETEVLALLGAGPLAAEHARALARVRSFAEVRVWSRDRARAEASAASLRAEGIPAVAVARVADAAFDAAVVCTLTPARDPFLAAGMLAEGAHVNAIGSPPRPAYSELCADVFAGASAVVVDDRSVALAESGNVRRAMAVGALDVDRLVLLGDVLTGAGAGIAASGAGPTVFNSTGLGLQDLYAAAYVMRRASAADTGTMVAVRE